MHNLFWVLCLCLSSLVSNPKWRLRKEALWKSPLGFQGITSITALLNKPAKLTFLECEWTIRRSIPLCWDPVFHTRLPLWWLWGRQHAPHPLLPRHCPRLSTGCAKLTICHFRSVRPSLDHDESVISDRVEGSATTPQAEENINTKHSNAILTDALWDKLTSQLPF